MPTPADPSPSESSSARTSLSQHRPARRPRDESWSLTVDGVRLAARSHPAAAVVDDGTSSPRPVLFLHGTGLNHVMWRATGFLDTFADRPCVTVDARGHGASDAPHDPEAYTDLAADALALVTHLRSVTGQVPDVVGYSAGGRAALTALSQRPEALHRVVALAPALTVTPDIFDRLFAPGAITILRTEGMEAFLSAWEARNNEPLAPPLRHAFGSLDPRSLAAFMEGYTQGPVVTAQDVARAAAADRVTLIVGDEDAERAADAEHWDRELAGLTLHRRPGRGHSTIMTDPVVRELTRKALDAPEHP